MATPGSTKRDVPLQVPLGTEASLGIPTPKTQYATAEDWKAKKDIIKDLYLTRYMPLRRVRAIMESEHKLRAT